MAKVNPSIPHRGGPTGVGAGAAGEDTYSYKEIAYAQAHGFAGLTLVKGTEPFSGGAL